MAPRKDSGTSAGTRASSASGAGDLNSVQQSRPRQRKSEPRLRPTAETARLASRIRQDYYSDTHRPSTQGQLDCGDIAEESEWARG